MFIYNGKFNWLQPEATNETITIIFPAGFALNDPVSAYWQWTKDAMVEKKASVISSGVVNSVTTTADGYSRIHFSFGYYSFNVTVTADYKTMTMTMRSEGHASSPFDLAAMYINPTSIPSVSVYTGTLQYLTYAESEMATLVVPYGIAEGVFVGLYFQWTVDGSGVAKANHPINATFQDVVRAADGTVTAAISDGFYTYRFTFNSEAVGSLVMSHPGEGTSPEIKLTLAYSL